MDADVSFRSVAALKDFEGALWWASRIQANNGTVPEDLRHLFAVWCAENDLDRPQRRPWMRTVPWLGRNEPDLFPPGAATGED